MPSIDGKTSEKPYDPTYTGSKHERSWLHQSLYPFFEDKLFRDILYRVQGGKEATIYCCEAGPTIGLPFLAAKVFRPRMFRAMRNDSHYKLGRGMIDAEGKRVIDARSRRALIKKTRYGKRLDTASWVRHEYRALRDLFDAGADVPRPIACGENAMLMEFVGDEHGPAPILHSVALPPDEARALFDRLIENVEIMLSRYRIHADLSAYNVLYRDGDVKIIDFPQNVDAINHPDAFALFSRDVDRLCRYFDRQGVETDACGIALDLWRRWMR